MEATFTQVQRDIEASLRSIAKEEKATARDALAGGWAPPACDAVLLADFGLLGVPEPAGGAGSPLVDLLVAVEVLGEHLVPSRFPAHAAAVQLASGLGALPDDVIEGRKVLSPAVDVPGEAGWPGRGTAGPRARTAPRTAACARWCRTRPRRTGSRRSAPTACGSPFPRASPRASRSIRPCRCPTSPSPRR
ncbi:hypothetical protein ACQEU6_03680 [Spirillospora sp. CA-108201]